MLSATYFGSHRLFWRCSRPLLCRHCSVVIGLLFGETIHQIGTLIVVRSVWLVKELGTSSRAALFCFHGLPFEGRNRRSSFELRWLLYAVCWNCQAIRVNCFFEEPAPIYGGVPDAVFGLYGGRIGIWLPQLESLAEAERISILFSSFLATSLHEKSGTIGLPARLMEDDLSGNLD